MSHSNSNADSTAPSSSRPTTLDDVFELLHEAEQLQQRAASESQRGESLLISNKKVAAQKYQQAVEAMRHYLRVVLSQENNSDEEDQQIRELLNDKIQHYEQVAAQLLRGSMSVTEPPSDLVHENDFLTSKTVQTATPTTKPQPDQDERIQQAEALFAQAQALASSSYSSDKIQIVKSTYLQSAELYLAAIQQYEPQQQNDDDDGRTVQAWKRRLEGILDRVEQLKQQIEAQDEQPMPSAPLEPTPISAPAAASQTNKATATSTTPVHSRGSTPPRTPTHNRGSTPPPTASSSSATTTSQTAATAPGSRLTAREIEILKQSSLIASGLFLPWSDDDALALNRHVQALYKNNKSQWSSLPLYKDPDGDLPLNIKQKKRFYKWARPSEIIAQRQLHQQPVVVDPTVPISPYTIRQSCVTDCSFIASLCACAAYEQQQSQRRASRTSQQQQAVPSLIANILYPQSTTSTASSSSSLLYNPQGKYLVKLWLNGVARCVVIDDYLPVDKYGNLLCSHTSRTTKKGGGRYLELWVSLIEKAYMKMCGGYDFPGSNSGVDLFSLTGWIPERIMFAKNESKVEDFEISPERCWERIVSASSFGDCLMTTSTTDKEGQEMSEADLEALGLVTGHAYAILRVVETRPTAAHASPVRLLQLKNPWASQGWKGRYSRGDTANWSDAALCQQVGYRPSEHNDDDGVFWICWSDILRFFQNFHLSWNPSLFQYRTTLHEIWPKDQGPKDDSYNIGDNPQFVLEFSPEAVKQKSTVWILVSRHVTKQEQEGCEVNDFLTVHLHRNSAAKKRIWYPGSSGKCILTGAYTNNPHVLARYDLSGPSDQYLSMVLSQYKKSNDLPYTLSCYSTGSFRLGKPKDDLEHVVQFSSAWTNETAGGSVNAASFLSNPQFAVSVPSDGTRVQFRVSTVKDCAVNVIMAPVEQYGQRADRETGPPAVDTGKYRRGFLVSETKRVSRGTYVVIVSSFETGQTGPFVLKVCSSHKLRVEQIVSHKP